MEKLLLLVFTIGIAILAVRQFFIDQTILREISEVRNALDNLIAGYFKPPNQETPIIWDPVRRIQIADKETAEEYRRRNIGLVWIFDPWNGLARNREDVSRDAFGMYIDPHKSLMELKVRTSDYS